MTGVSAWPDVALSDAVDFLDSQRRPVKVGARAKMRGSIPYYGASGIVDYVDRYLFDEDLILLGEDGENILSRVVPLAFKITGKSWVNNHAHVLRPRRAFDIDFLTAYLESLDYSGLNSGTAQPKLNKQACSAVRVMRPPVDEQRAIARVLLDVENLITTLEDLIAKKRAIKQGIMQQLLVGRMRLPGFSEQWRPRRLGDMLSYEQPGRYLVQTSTQLQAGRVPVLTAGKTFILGYTNETHGIYTAHPVIIFDDFTTASKYVDFDFKAKSSAMKILSARPGVDLRFIYERMQLVDFPLGDHKRHWISEYGRQSVVVPDQPEQCAIAAVLSDAEADISLLRGRLAKANAIRQGIRQQLLTGRTRLSTLAVAA